MADALVLGASTERCRGSSPLSCIASERRKGGPVATSDPYYRASGAAMAIPPSNSPVRTWHPSLCRPLSPSFLTRRRRTPVARQKEFDPMDPAAVPFSNSFVDVLRRAVYS